MTKENIHVAIRFRPTNKREKKEAREKKMQNKPPIFQNDDKRGIGVLEICGNKSMTPHTFTFDRIIDANVSQEDTFYHVAEHVCDDVLDGYNGCIFAYGQTGSGKTYTMFGPEGDNAHPQKMGIIPRSISYIFTEIEEDPDIVEARIKVSFVEIYKEKLRDLLNPSSKKPLAIRLQQNGETRIQNVTETHVLTLLDVLSLMEVASSYRTKAETSMNHSSSRSHMLMTLTVALKLDDGSIGVGKLNFCDLAGSEKVRKTNATGTRLKEAQKINLSLTILGQVISALSQNKVHVPFRDSQLTHVLKDSLGGNCKTTLIVNCTKHMFNRDETINSLRFGSRCKLIANEVKVNRIYSNAELMNMIEKLRRQNAKLNAMLRDKGYAEDIIASPKSNKLFDKKKKEASNYDYYNTDQAKQLLDTNKILKEEINKMDDKYHYLQIQNNQLEDKLHSLVNTLQSKEKQYTMLNSRLVDYQSQTQQQQKDIHILENDNQHLKLKIKSTENLNDEYRMEIGDITKDRHYKTTKLNSQLLKFKELHQDAQQETTELMDEVLKLKQSLEKSEAIIDAQDHQLTAKRKDLDDLNKELVEKERRVSNIFKEKMSLQTKLDKLKTTVSKYESDLSQKEDEIGQLKDELDQRTQELTAQNHELTQKLEQREMIQHAYSIRSADPMEAIKEIDDTKSPTASGAAIKTNTAMLNAGINLSSGALHHPKMVPSFEPSFEEIAPELLIQSATIHNADDVIHAEQSLMGKYDYLQKRETERLDQRHSTGGFSKRRKSKLEAKKKKHKRKAIYLWDPKEQKKTLQRDVDDKKKLLESLRKMEMPSDKDKRLKIFLKIGSLEDDLRQLKRKIKSLDKKIKKGSKKDVDEDMVNKVTTKDVMNYIDAALTLHAMKSDDDDDDFRYIV